MGKKIVLTADRTLFSSYRRTGLFDFLGCIPSERIPDPIFELIAPVESPLTSQGIARVAPYGLRKVEASLLSGDFSREEVAVVHPSYVSNFIDEETDIVGVSTMDPLGLGPVSMSFTVGGKYTAFDKKYFLQLMRKLNLIRIERDLDFKLIVGGPSAWQLTEQDGVRDSLRIDHVILGETEHKISQIFKRILHGDAEEVIDVSSSPTVEEIPPIRGGSVRGIVEVQRGCGRGCQFCEPNMRNAKYMPLDKIEKEIKVNLAYGEKEAWLHSEDIFLYKLRDKKDFHSNSEAVINLFKRMYQIDGLKKMGPTHCSISPIVDNPEMLRRLTHIMMKHNAGPEQLIGVQPGLETGSPRLMGKYMRNKAKPFTPEEWPDVVVEGTKLLNKNHWYPAYTLILGLPDARKGDALQTLRLIDRMETEVSEAVGNPHFVVAPLTFVPLGALGDQGTFDLYHELNEYQFAVIYRCWRWIVKETRKDLLHNIQQPFLLRALIYTVSNLGGKLILRELEKFAESRGFDVGKALNPP